MLVCDPGGLLPGSLQRAGSPRVRCPLGLASAPGQSHGAAFSALRCVSPDRCSLRTHDGVSMWQQGSRLVSVFLPESEADTAASVQE